MVIGVVDQDVEHHSAKQLLCIRQMCIALAHADSAKDSSELWISHFWLCAGRCGCSDGSARRDAVNPLTVHAVKPANGYGVSRSQMNDLGLGNGDASLSCQRHGRVLNERRVDVFVVKEFDNPLFAIDVDKRLGFCTT